MENTSVAASMVAGVRRVFALTEATIALDAVLPDDPFSATPRNVATLDEYWCFVALVKP